MLMPFTFQLRLKSIFLLLLSTIIVNANAQAPTNDEPCNAIELTPSVACVFATYSTLNATGTNVPDPGCAGYNGGDVWFKITVPASGNLTIETDNVDFSDGGMALYTGTCNNLSLVACDDDGASGHMPKITATGLTPNATVWVRVWENGNNDSGDFKICVTTIIPPTPPVNDDPCNAILLPVTSTCNFTIGNNTNATGSIAPAPGCANYLGGDVWYKAVVPANGYINFNTQAGVVTNGGMALYRGSCSSLSLIACNDDSGPGGMPEMSFINLTPGDTIWIRFWDRSNDNFGTFGICANSQNITDPIPCTSNLPAGNTCATATPICNLDGYCGNTSSTYTADYWPELNTEFNSCLGGASIQNNSFLKFVAASTSATFNVWVTSTVEGVGIQMFFFEANNCAGPVVCHGGYDNLFPGPSHLITANNLTVGNTYYLMLDGVNGDVCDYVINAVNGLSSLVLSPVNPTICNGQSVQLTASGVVGPGTSYSWSWVDQNSQPQTFSGTTLNVSPSVTTVYTSTVTGTGVCPQVKLDTVTVNDSSTYTAPPVTQCNSYTWHGTTYSTSGIYIWRGTNSVGCDSIVTLDITIKKSSAFTEPPVTQCGAYTWHGTTYSTSGTYTWTGTNSVGCDSVVTLNITINNVSAVTEPSVSECNPYTWHGTTYSTSGTYTWTGTNSAGCDSVVTLNLTINSPTTYTEPPVTQCGAYTWHGTTYSTSGTYTWTGTNSLGCDSVVTLSLTINKTSAFTEPPVSQCNPYTWHGTTYSTSGTYTWTGTNSAGCDSVVTLNLTIFSNNILPTFSSYGPYCQNQVLPTVILPTTSNNNITGVWSPASISSSTVGTAVYTFTPNSGQCATNVLLSIITNPLPIPVNAGPSVTIFQGNTIQLQASAPNANQFLWSPSTGIDNPALLQPNASPDITTIYTLTASNSFGCSVSDSMIVTVEKNKCIIDPSKIFTPNHDGFYETWIVYTGTCIKKVEASVYNRWGGLVYHSDNYQNDWNGMNQNKPLPDATYYYVLIITENNGITYTRKGNVTIMR